MTGLQLLDVKGREHIRLVMISGKEVDEHKHEQGKKNINVFDGMSSTEWECERRMREEGCRAQGINISHLSIKSLSEAVQPRREK